ncbi:hypothetical protein D5S18_22950 [Nocardia panacis]|uniref:Low molecular weight antigen MTB12-like C-terminal domain-containing protein n=1 Tax=Nocardia panacis TaxID=2340916 RepID=A0A3A4KDE1_9NOCA|nr:hypothetical protein [Nocardia panacis]RJO72042.1 hypothetical protein D5S18_22950 [Nocardia panacis]
MTRTRKTLGALAVALATVAGVAGGAALASATPITAPAHTNAPGTGELRAKMAVAFNAGAARADRANELEPGEAGLPAFDRAAALIAIAPSSWRWDITGPVTADGDRLNATLYTATDGYDPWTFDMSWKRIDGTWKLSRESVCTLAGFVGAPCP